MTSMTAEAEVFKQDSRGRVTGERSEALLDEFESSGASGVKFARLAGIKYQTFAGWVQRRRKQRVAIGPTMGSPPGNQPLAGAGAVRLFEAVVEGGNREALGAMGAQGLLIELPGGSRMRVESAIQMQMAAELVALIAQRARTRC